MASFHVEVEGLKEVQKAIRDLGDKDLKKALRLANKQAAEVVASAAREKTPVRTGKLRRSVRATATQVQGSVKLGGPTAPYGGFIDYGNKIGQGGAVGRGDTVPRDFLFGGRIVYPALNEHRQDVTDVFAREIDQVIDAAGFG